MTALRWLPPALVLGALLPATARGATAEIPVDVGIGPAACWFFGPLTDERGAIPHLGLKLNVEAVIDAEFIDRNQALIPAQYRRQAQHVSEIRVRPLFLILVPDSLVLSPRLDALGGTGIYGATWRPLSLGIPLYGHTRGRPSAIHLDLDAGLLFTYAYIQSVAFPDTHFLRPGIDVKLELELVASRVFSVSLGWASQVYVPQKLGTFELGWPDESIFHVGQAFLKLHFRFPYEYRF